MLFNTFFKRFSGNNDDLDIRRELQIVKIYVTSESMALIESKLID